MISTTSNIFCQSPLVVVTVLGLNVDPLTLGVPVPRLPVDVALVGVPLDQERLAHVVRPEEEVPGECPAGGCGEDENLR